MTPTSPFAHPNEAGQSRADKRDLPTGTVTLLFTDIQGSTRLLQHLGERFTSLLEVCRSLLRGAFQQWNGHEVDTRGT